MDRLSAFLCGAVFAVGLAISGMIRPSKVLDFLDVTGHWDPSLAFVMGGALAVFLPGYRLVTRRQRPVLAARFDLPKSQGITWQLLLGAIVFGVGWAVSGFCPAAAVAAIPALNSKAIGATLGIAVGIVGMRAARGLASTPSGQGERPAPKEPPPQADF